MTRYGGGRNCIAMSGDGNIELPMDNGNVSSRLFQYNSNSRTSFPPVSDSSSDDGWVQNPCSEFYWPEALYIMPSELPPFM